MAVTIYYEQDCNPDIIKDKKIAIIGYGSQGHAHALNLKDSGCDVRVGLREGSHSIEAAEEAGLRVTDMATAAEEADLIMVLVPDELQPEVYETYIAPHLKAGDTLAFAHGFNVHYGYITPPEDVNVIMCAPKGPGHIVRRQYTEGSGVPDLICVAQDATGTPGASRYPTPGAWAVRVPASSRPPSPRRPRRTSLASRPCSAAVWWSW